MKRSQLSRLDLLQALANADTQSSLYLAEALGLVCEFTQAVSSATTSLEDAGAAMDLLSRTDPENSAEQLTNVLPRPSFFLLQGREAFETELAASEEQAATSWNAQPESPLRVPKHHFLGRVRDLLPRLKHVLLAEQCGRQLDIEAMVAAVSRGRYLTHLPRQAERRFNQTVHFLTDRAIRLTPYWRDHDLLQRLLLQGLPQHKGDYAVLSEGRTEPRQYTPMGLADWSIPEPSSALVIFSDLGALERYGDSAAQVWLQIGERLHRQQCHALVVLPCHPDDCDPRLRQWFKCVPWQMSSSISQQEASPWAQPIEHLLTVLAPAIRIEPSLLRQMRLSMAQFGSEWQWDARVEAGVWQDPALLERHSRAASWEADSRQDYLQKFAQLDAGQQTAALEVIKTWRTGLSEQIWFEELTSLDAKARQLPSLQADVQAANAYYQQLSQSCISPTCLDEALREWLQRSLKRLPATALADQVLGQSLQHLQYQVFEGQRLQGINPQQLPRSDLSVQQLELAQQGQYLYLLPFDPLLARPLGFSPLAWLRLRRPFVQVVLESGSTLPLTLDKPLALPSGETFEVISDYERLCFTSWQRPVWAEALGRDQYGLFMDLVFHNIPQRFRYIPPQTFLMGSPADEEGRSSDETQHLVTLTQGYWLADTTVTQALWQAVMGKNPSCFKGEQLPVERVSWEDAQAFIQSLSRAFPALPIRLPTEAEWECACRAGTVTAFYFGGKDELNLDQVNYSGEWDKYNAKRTTKPVKSYPPNAWGLYEMHGNVWEWCNDWYSSDYGDQFQTDPTGASSGEWRVLRAGSWFDFGRYCRSADRNWGTPDDWNDGSGFRFALSHIGSGTGQEQTLPDFNHQAGSLNEQARHGIAPAQAGRLLVRVVRPSKLTV